MDCSLSCSSVLGISQARILKWVAISFSRGSSQSRDRICISWVGRQILHHWATGETLLVPTTLLTYLAQSMVLVLYLTVESSENHCRCEGKKWALSSASWKHISFSQSTPLGEQYRVKAFTIRPFHCTRLGPACLRNRRHGDSFHFTWP